MRCTMLDYGVTEGRVYNQGVELPDITGYTSGPYMIIPYSNYVLYMPFKGYIKVKDFAKYELYDENDTLRVLVMGQSIYTLEQATTMVEKGTPWAVCAIEGNTKRAKVSKYSSIWSYFGAGFVVAFYDMDTSVIFPDGIPGGVQTIEGTAIQENQQCLVWYSKLVSRLTTTPYVGAIVRERGSGVLPVAPSIKNNKYVEFKGWSSSQLSEEEVTDTSESVQYIYAFYTPIEDKYETIVYGYIRIKYSEYGNPVIPKDAPSQIPVIWSYSKAVPDRAPVCYSSFPPLVEKRLKLSWYTEQDLYLTGWKCLQATTTLDTWQVRGIQDGVYSFAPMTFPQSIPAVDRVALFIAPSFAYIEREDVVNTAKILLLDKAAGVDRIEEYELKGEETGLTSLYVTIDTNPVSYVKAWRGITAGVARYMAWKDTQKEHYPPSNFYDIDNREGLQWGSFGVLEWTPNDANYDTSGGDPDIIPILFLLGRVGKFPLKF